jgi:hypothetical protein
MHKISWNGEWLPVELWTRVFCYMLVPVSDFASVFLSFPAKQVVALQEHPLIAGIIEEFLQFRSGITYADLRDAWRQNKTSPFHHFRVSYWPRFRGGKDSKVTQSTASFDYEIDADGRRRFRFGLGYGNLYFAPTYIRIGIGSLKMRPGKTAADMKLRDCDLKYIEYFNDMLPYGLHFRFSRGDLCLFALNNPRTNPEHRFQYIRVITWKILTGFEGEPTYWLNVCCTISLNEIYVPSWRPYYVSRDGDGDAESRDSGGDA